MPKTAIEKADLANSPEAIAARALANSVNPMNFGHEVFAIRLCHYEHRTLQQNAMRAMLACMAQWAKDHDTNVFDARNEATCRLAKKIITALGDDFYLPII